MRVSGLLLTVVCGCVAISGCTQTADTAYSDDKAASTRLCLSAVSKRTGNGNVAVVRTNSRNQSTTVYVGVGPERNQYRCRVEKNGPANYYIGSISRV